MPVNISTKHAFPNLSCDELYDIYTNQDILQTRYENIGARNVNFTEFDGTKEQFTIKSNREIYADIPKLLKKFASEWNLVTQTDTWRQQSDGTYIGDVHVHIQAELPVEFTGTMHVKPDGSGCSNYIEMRVTCPVRIVGKVAEQFVKGRASESINDEYTALLDILNQTSA